MADYWVSRDKYFCKYCKIYISDDKPSRTHHETGLRHKGNYERYIRDMYKKGITEKKEAKEEAKEIARIEAAAAAAMGLSAPDPVPTPSSSKPKPAAPKSSSDPYANYTTAENLGLKDDFAEQLKKEQEQREKEGTIGQWQRVVKPQHSLGGKGKAPEVVPTGGFVKVKKESEAEETEPLLIPAGDVVPPAGTGATAGAEAEEDDTHPVSQAKKRGFLTEKTAPSYLDDDDDLPSLGPIKLKKRRLTVKEQAALQAEEEEKRRAEEEQVQVAKERKTGGGWAAARLDEDEGFDPLAGLAPPVPVEGEAEAGAAEAEKPDVKLEEEEKPQVAAATPAAGGFKKRKMHGAGATRKK
ncbi:hypothetical protein JCM11251_004172 [Rhodosporidiobolus azoricus]